jgi:SAM-dependent methyltransferase
LTAAVKALAKRVLPKRARIALRRAYYFGFKFGCPVCGARIRQLLDSGKDLPILRALDVVGGFRSDDVCPVCWSNGRHRLVSTYLKREVFSAQHTWPRTVLHFAPEPYLPVWLQARPNVEYVAADLRPGSYPDVPGIRQADLTRLPWEDDYFDLVLCNHVLEHVPDDRRAMQELYRTMRPGGVALVQVPFGRSLPSTIEDPSIDRPEERERRFGQHDHVRLYGPDYTERLRNAGFATQVFDPLTEWGPSVIESLRLNPEEKLHLARK